MRNRSNLPLPAVFADYEPMRYGSGRVQREPSVLSIFEMTYLHFHRYLELGICVSGSGVCRVEGEEYPFTDGDVQVIFPFQSHLSINTGTENGKWYWAYLDPVPLLSEAGLSDPLRIETWLRNEMALCGIIDKREYPEIAKCVGTLLSEVYDPSESHVHPDESFAQCLYRLILELCDASAGHRMLPLGEVGNVLRIAPALDQIKASLESGEIPEVSSLSGLCCMSVSNFRRVFGSTIGVPPKEYIAACCVRKAQMLLLTSELSILDVAMAVGFLDISGFNRRFLAEVGMTPSEFRREFSAKQIRA